MKLYYDFHIHSCLSPCGDADMTPNNIVNYAKIMGYDVIALTDHNTALNCPAVAKLAEENGITFEVPNANAVIVKGIDKQVVGQIAAQIRSKRPPEPYHGKGVKYADEHIRRKAGKTGK